jgi:ABC-type dipeptide/oligopeptide/nickel transport system permease component
MITTRKLDLSLLVPLFALVSGITSAIVFWWNRGSLWEDEIIAITHGLESFPDFFIQILRNE